MLALTIGSVLVLAAPASAAIPLKPVSVDPYTNTSSYHQTEVEPDNFAFGSTIVGTFQVGRFTDGGASNIGWGTSTDNGGTWTHGYLPSTTPYSTPPGPWPRISDPAVAYDPEHNVWIVATLALDAGLSGKAVLVSRSSDGGQSFGAPITVSQGGAGAFYDKSWITCDTTATSPFYGNCYVQWDDAGIGGRMRMSRSTDGGLTWTASTVPSAFGLGGQPVTQPNGTVVVSYTGNGIQSLVSTDGGATYTGPFTVASYTDHFVAGNLRTQVLPSSEVDGVGRVYVVWQDCRFRTGCTANDPVMSTSTNGTTWTQVVRIPAVPAGGTADLFLPSIGADRTTGGATAHLGVTFYFYPQASCTVNTCKLAAGYTSSTDGGATWTPIIALFGGISLKSLPLTTLGYMVGDYTSTAIAANHRAYTVIPIAAAGTCTLGQITSCKERMVAPGFGLPVAPGTIRADDRPVVGWQAHIHTRAHTATAY
jgi:hypothetical protein